MSGTDTTTIAPGELFARQKRGEPVQLIDVRTPLEYRGLHIPGSRLLPLDELESASLELDTSEKIYLTCQSGIRSEQAAEQLQQRGFHNTVVVEGGTDAWDKAGLPLKRGGRVISLERQVQITIGSLLLLKVIFGFTLHELFFLAGAVIGLGLIVAGVTRWCGLARLIARMPWNRIDTPQSSATV